MPDERDFDAKSELRDVLAALLALVLPAEQHELIPRLTDMALHAPLLVSTARSRVVEKSTASASCDRKR